MLILRDMITIRAELEAETFESPWGLLAAMFCIKKLFRLNKIGLSNWSHSNPFVIHCAFGPIEEYLHYNRNSFQGLQRFECKTAQTVVGLHHSAPQQPVQVCTIKAEVIKVNKSNINNSLYW